MGQHNWKRKSAANTISNRKKRHNLLTHIKAEVDFAHYLQNYIPTRLSAPKASVQATAERSLLMALPPELRTTIYEYVLAKPKALQLYHQPQYALCNGPAILRTSMQLRKEALPVYFKSNNVVVHALLVHFDKVASWLQYIAESCGKRAFGGLQFRVQWCPWSHLPKIEPLVQLIASDTIELDLDRVDITAPFRVSGSDQTGCLFAMNDLQGGMFVQRAIEEAVLIGAMAMKQKWSASKLYHQFDVLMALKLPLKQLWAYNRIEQVEERKAKRRRWQKARDGDSEP